MPYHAEMDPENAVDLRSYADTLEMIGDEYHENDQDFILETMAEWLTSKQDQHAKDKFHRLMAERAQKMLDRAIEAQIAAGARP